MGHYLSATGIEKSQGNQSHGLDSLGSSQRPARGATRGIGVRFSGCALGWPQHLLCPAQGASPRPDITVQATRIGVRFSGCALHWPQHLLCPVQSATPRPDITEQSHSTKRPRESPSVGLRSRGRAVRAVDALGLQWGPLPHCKAKASTALDDFAGAHAARTPLFEPPAS